MSSSHGAEGVLSHLSKLDQLDWRVYSLAVAANLVYWNVGDAYKEFAWVRPSAYLIHLDIPAELVLAVVIVTVIIRSTMQHSRSSPHATYIS